MHTGRCFNTSQFMRSTNSFPQTCMYSPGSILLNGYIVQHFSWFHSSLIDGIPRIPFTIYSLCLRLQATPQFAWQLNFSTINYVFGLTVFISFPPFVSLPIWRFRGIEIQYDIDCVTCVLRDLTMGTSTILRYDAHTYIESVYQAKTPLFLQRGKINVFINSVKRFQN